MRLKRNLLLTPGPATTTDTVKRAQVVSDICPREKAFSEVMAEVSADLIKIAGCGPAYAAVLLGGSGTAAVEAVINSAVRPGKRLAVVNNGAYGERMIEIAEAYGIPTVELKGDGRTPPTQNQLRDLLAGAADIDCLAMVHHETTTGLRNPIETAGRLAREYGCFFMVDAISSFGGIPVDLVGSGIDFMAATANKCLQGMPGVSFVLGRRKALEKIGRYPPRSCYLNLSAQYAYFLKHGQLRFTAPVQTLYALKQALEELVAEGLSHRWQRYRRNWEVLRTGLEEMGLKFLLKKENEAGLLLTVLEPNDPHYDFGRMHDLLLDRGFTIYPGKLQDQRSFRLGTIGAINENDLRRFLKTFRQVLVEMGVC